MYTSIFCHTLSILQSSAHINPFKDHVSIKISMQKDHRCDFHLGGVLVSLLEGTMWQ